MKFFDASRYASPLRKALDKKENAPRNLRFETLENRALLSVTPLDNLETIAASAEIAPAQTVETPVVDLSTLAVSNATVESNADDQYEENDAYSNPAQLGELTQKITIEAIAGPNRDQDWYRVTFKHAGTADDYLLLENALGTTVNLQLYLKTTSNSEVARSQTTNSTERISLEGVPAGEYLIQVYNATISNVYAPYTLTIEPPKPETDDQYEGELGNDTSETAYDLGMAGSTSFVAKAGPNNNHDVFKFTTVAEGTEDDSIKLDYSQAKNAALLFKVYDQPFHAGVSPIFDSGNVANAGKVIEFSLAGKQAGDYYVEIYNNASNSDGFARYTLSINAPKVAPAAPTGFVTDKTEDTWNYTTLSWNAVENVSYYELEVSVKGGAWTPVQTFAPETTSYKTENLAYGTAYKYRINAVRVFNDAPDASATTVLASETWTEVEFSTVDLPETPTDAKYSTLDPQDKFVTLSWEDVATTELGYVVERYYGETEGWKEIAQLDADATSYKAEGLELGTPYSYRVAAVNNAGYSEFLAFDFTTENVPDAPTGLTVEHEASENPTATLTWNDAPETGVESVVSYTVTVYEKTVDAETGEASFVARAPQTVSAATYTVENLLPSGVYYFEIVANNAYGASEALTSDQFTVGALIDETAQYVDVTVFGAAQPTATVEWASVEGATSYYVAILDAEGNTVYEIDDFAVADSSTPTLEIPATVGEGENAEQTLLLGQTYVCQVYANNAYGRSKVCAEEEFTVGDVPTEVPTITEVKVNAAAQPTATISWSPSLDVSEYRLQIYRVNGDDLGETLVYDDTATFSMNFGDNVYTVPALNADGEQIFELGQDYVCRIYAVNAYGVAETAGEYDFTVGDVPEESSALTATVNASTAPTATLTWADLATEEGYRVEILGADGETWETVETLEADATEWTTDVEMGATYQYRVVAVNAYGETASNAVEFTVGNVADAPVLVATVNASTAPTVTLNWTNVEGETGYRVEVQAEDETGTYVWTPLAKLAADVDNYTTDVQMGQTYYYRVVALNEYGENASAHAWVTVGDVADAPVLAATVNASSAPTATLTWADLATEEGYRVEILGADGETWEAVETLAADATEWTTDVEMGATYQYRVVAVNAYGETASNAVEFTVGNVADAPVLSATVNASSAPTATLTWADLATETGYRVEILGADGETWETVETLEADATEWTTDVEMGATYQYRVVAVNAYGETASNVETVVVGNVPAAPTHLKTNGDEAIWNKTTLSWDDVETETGYELQVSTDAGATWTAAGTLAADATMFEAVDLNYGTAYKYQLRAVNEYGASDWVDLEFSTVGVPALPTNLAVSKLDPETRTVTLTWDDVADETEYLVVLFTSTGQLQAVLPANTTSWTPDVAIALGSSAFFSVVPANNAGPAVGAANLTFTVEDVPTAPTDLVATFDETTKNAMLTWSDNANDETGYVVEEYVDDAWTTVATLAADATNWNAELFLEGRHVYRVVAVNNYGQAASDSAELEAFGVRPAAPNALTLGPYDSATSQLQMSWDDVEGETSYRVEASYDGENWWFSQNLNADVTERIATLGYKDRPYFFRVRAENQYGVSEWTTAKYNPAPTQPGALKFTSYDPASGKLEMSWGNSLNETRYRVEASYDGENWWFSQNLDANVTERVATLGYKNRPYYFRVRAESAVGVSEWTVAQFNPQPSAPQAFEFGAYDHRTGELEMSWSDVEGETRYRVEASYDGENWWFSQNTSTDVINRVAKLGYTDREYFFRVRAENLAGVSEWTTAKFTPPVLTTPEAPTSLVFDSYDAVTGSLVMSWTGVTKQATQLRVEFTYDGGATWAHSQTLSGVETGRTAKIGWPSKTYQFRICAINVQGVSEWTYSELFNANEWNAADPISAAFADLFADDDDEFWFEL